MLYHKLHADLGKGVRAYETCQEPERGETWKSRIYQGLMVFFTHTFFLRQFPSHLIKVVKVFGVYLGLFHQFHQGYCTSKGICCTL